jgi:cytochrome b561
MTETQPTRGYSATAKALHWLTVAALAAQFWVGYTMDADASSDNAVDAAKEAEKAAKDAAYPDEAGEEAAEEAAKAAVDAAKDHNYVVGTGDGIDALELHVGLGALILVLGIARVTHRRLAGLPPWAPRLSARARTIATRSEQLLLLSLFTIPISGLALVLTGNDDLVPLHVGAHVGFFAALAVHLGNVVWHTVLRRHGLLRRMLP